jgi:hypothetical protein
MAKLNFKQDRDSWRIREARASRAVGGKYRIFNRGVGCGFLIKYRPSPEKKENRWLRWWWDDVGIAATESEAVALAQADNDKKLAAVVAVQHA